MIEERFHMQEMNERPVCHRAEDLVTYLYGEAGESDARDFREHLQQCDACRSEFAVFNQVHESILVWRNEALGPAFNPAAIAADPAVDSTQFVRHERKLSALAALREFFSVSPLWLRGATAFAALLLCALLIFAAARIWRQPTSNGENEAKYTDKQLREEVEKQVKEQVAKMNQTQAQTPTPEKVQEAPAPQPQRTQIATDRDRTHTHPRNRLTREERVQLAADLGLIQGREEEMPFVLPDQPNQ